MPSINEIITLLSSLQEQLPSLRTANDTDFLKVRDQWLATTEAMKDAVFVANPKQQHPDRKKFEFAAGAQSILFMADLLPHLHRRMTENYDRFERLTLLDVGAGSGAGTQLLAQIHSDTMIWSKLDISAIDYVDWRRRWVAMHYPKIDYRVQASAELPANTWDFVVCSHVIEHLDDPRAMIADVLRACRGFAFIYAPYNEAPLSPGHRSMITKATFSGFDVEEIHITKSMGFYGEGRQCIIAIFDCRNPARAVADQTQPSV